MFSTKVVVRQLAGKQLKVVDTNKIQAVSNIKTNTLVDRYTKMFKSGALANQNNYQANRFTLYSEYDAMDTEAIVSSVLDIIADESTVLGPNNEMLNISSSNEAVDRVLKTLFYDVLNIEFNLWWWVRSMCKYGDCVLHLSLADQIGVFNVTALPIQIVEREEGYDLAHPDAVRFKVGDLNYSSYYTNTKADARYFDSYEIAHFRMLADHNFQPYGRSYLEPARKTHKQYVLLKDALLIHQIMRAPEKRTFFVDVGAIPANEITPFMQGFINNVKKVPFIDPETGDYNLRYNLQNAMEDFYIPVRGDNAATKIDTTSGLQNTGATEVVDFLRDELFAAFKVPKAFMGYEKDLEGKATLSQQDLRFGRTIERIQRIIVSELYKIAQIHLTLQGFSDEEVLNFELSLNTPSIVMEQEKIALLAEKMSVAQSMIDSGLFSSDHIYEEVFQMTEEQYIPMREGILADKRRIFRQSQVENEGNDPNISGKSFGTPHDLAVLYGIERGHTNSSDALSAAASTEPVNPEGRPQIHASNYGTQDHMLGKDPLGKDGSVNNVNVGPTPVIPVRRTNPLALSEKYNRYQLNKSIVESLKAVKEVQKPLQMLNESNILDI